jgi:hypothetical protein
MRLIEFDGSPTVVHHTTIIPYREFLLNVSSRVDY